MEEGRSWQGKWAAGSMRRFCGIEMYGLKKYSGERIRKISTRTDHRTVPKMPYLIMMVLLHRPSTLGSTLQPIPDHPRVSHAFWLPAGFG